MKRRRPDPEDLQRLEETRQALNERAGQPDDDVEDGAGVDADSSDEDEGGKRGPGNGPPRQ